jgi:peptidoglycan/xylan/chitin deacetylase (PgdA/CDA1 family)
MSAALEVMMYHYVRDLPKSAFPRLKAMQVEKFRAQVEWLRREYEMATLESALAFLRGKYQPKRSLCLLTFDDGTREHFEIVAPFLAERKIQGIFAPITSSLRDRRVAAVQKNHFLMASLSFEDYAGRFRKAVSALDATMNLAAPEEIARATYRWDTPEVASFKYLLNYVVPEEIKEQAVGEIFTDHFGDEGKFCDELYFSWSEGRQMQEMGMLMAGHSHQHQALSTLSDERQQADLRTCTELLRGNMLKQEIWPFTYPYGKGHAFNNKSVELLKALEYECAFSTTVGSNAPGQDLYRIVRFDPKDKPQ